MTSIFTYIYIANYNIKDSLKKTNQVPSWEDSRIIHQPLPPLPVNNKHKPLHQTMSVENPLYETIPEYEGVTGSQEDDFIPKDDTECEVEGNTTRSDSDHHPIIHQSVSMNLNKETEESYLVPICRAKSWDQSSPSSHYQHLSNTHHVNINNPAVPATKKFLSLPQQEDDLIPRKQDIPERISHQKPTHDNGKSTNTEEHGEGHCSTRSDDGFPALPSLSEHEYVNKSEVENEYMDMQYDRPEIHVKKSDGFQLIWNKSYNGRPDQVDTPFQNKSFPTPENPALISRILGAMDTTSNQAI